MSGEILPRPKRVEGEILKDLQRLIDDGVLFYCDPKKNKRCKKTGCFAYGGPCRYTTSESCAMEVRG